MLNSSHKLKARQRLGKYIIERRLGEGGFSVVYQARDTIEGIRVALKIPHAHFVDNETIETFKQEVRIAARLEHPNILPLKHADFIDGRFVIVTALGEMTLEDRLLKRLSLTTAISFTKQMLDAVAFAHEYRVIHCDLKPDNMLIFPLNRIRLMDFGIARVAHKTLQGSGAGTVGYVAPEQAMGKPSFRSDVFSLGLILYRVFTGELPEWPFHWPPPGYSKLRDRVHPDLIELIKKSIDPDSRRRYRDAIVMQTAFRRIKSPVKRRSSYAGAAKSSKKRSRNWVVVRHREFLRAHGKQLEVCHTCKSCEGPVSEVMQSCPWCGKSRKKHTGKTARFSSVCPRCGRGLKSDWHYCPWCFGPGFEPRINRKLSDKRYVARCANSKCERKDLMLFMKYCPWCRRRVNKKWKIEGSASRCSSCGHGILSDYWTYCPWCGAPGRK